MHKTIYLLVFVLGVSPAFAQSDAAATAPPTLTENRSGGEAKENRLPIANPLFMPYQNQFYAEVQGGWQRYSSSIKFPAQTVSGLAFPDSSSSTTRDSLRLAAALSYGLHDRFTLAMELLYLVSEKSTTATTGIFASGASSNSSPGFYNPRFSAVGRLLGVNRNEWYLDVGLAYMPGINSADKNAFAIPQPEIDTRVRLGRNIGAWTAGIGTSIAYTFETMHQGTTYRSNTALITEAIIQYGVEKYFAEAGAGFIQYVDHKSASDPLNGKVRTIVHVSIGSRFSENVFAKASIGWLMPIAADFRESGLLFHVEEKGGPAAHVTVGLRF